MNCKFAKLFTILKALIVFVTLLSAVDSFAKNKRIITLEWEPVEGATAYEVQFQSIPDDPEIKSKSYGKIVESSVWKGLLPLGKYDFKVRSYDKRGVPGSWSKPEQINVKIPTVKSLSPKDKSKIKSKQDDEFEVTFRWRKGKSDDTYVLFIDSKDGQVKKEMKVEGTNAKVSLPVGKFYVWRVEIDEETVLKEPPGSGSRFVLIGNRLPAPEINKPDEEEDIENVSWKPVNNANSYSYYVARQLKTKKWKIISKQKKATVLNVAIPLNYPDGKYKLSVKAHGNYRPSSKRSTIEFNINRARKLAALETKEQLNYDPTWYGHANYYITNIKYENNETAGQTDPFDVIGGTGELGASYTKTNQPWGFYFLGSLGGFITSGRVNNYYSIETYLTHTNWKANKKSFRHSFGLYNKTYPHIWANDSGTAQFQEVSQLGLVYGINYWRRFQGPLGLSAAAKVYLGSDIGSVPGGTGSPRAGNSFKASILGSYNLTESATGYMGLTYYNEEVQWDSDTAESNSINILGTYLSFELDYKF